MRTTLKDIAEKSGYSISTISRVLNGSQNISTEVQRKVLALAETLGYPFDKSIIPYYSNGVKRILLLTDFHEGEFYSSFYAGYVKAADEMNVQLLLISVINELKSIHDVILSQRMGHIDGIVLFTPSLDHEDYKNLRLKLSEAKNNVPIISNGLIQSPVLQTITFDGYSGAHLAAYHLAQQGYKHVGLINGPTGKAESSFRSNGFKDGCHQKKLQIVWEVDGDFMFDSAFNSFQSYLKTDPKPEAVFVSNDLMAIGFFEAARNYGLKIPDDLAIIGYDDLPMCRQVRPEITSVRTDFYELGKQTIQSLLSLIQGQTRENKTLSFVPVQLKKRGST